MRVFLLDDDPIILAMMGYNLSETGYEVLYSLSPVDGNFYKELETFSPDIIIIDVHLKDENGCDIASNIRSMPLLSDCLLLAMSSDTEVRTKTEIYSSGFIEFIEKPFSPKQLESIINKYKPLCRINNLCNSIEKRGRCQDELYTKFN